MSFQEVKLQPSPRYDSSSDLQPTVNKMTLARSSFTSPITVCSYQTPESSREKSRPKSVRSYEAANKIDNKEYFVDLDPESPENSCSNLIDKVQSFFHSCSFGKQS